MRCQQLQGLLEVNEWLSQQQRQDVDVLGPWQQLGHAELVSSGPVPKTGNGPELDQTVTHVTGLPVTVAQRLLKGRFTVPQYLNI